MTKSLGLHLIVDDAERAARWYSRALGAVESSRLCLSDGTPMMIELDLDGTVLAVAASMPERGMRTPAELGASSAAFHLTVTDVDGAWERAKAAGASEFEPLHDAFWGERTVQFLDPPGHRWVLDQHLRDVPLHEQQARLDELLGGGT